jgi:hypothetical protein
MDGLQCTRILFAETKGLGAVVGNPGLQQARVALARIVLETSNGEGFAPGVDPTMAELATPSLMQAWQDCGAAAQQAAVERQQNLNNSVTWRGAIAFFNDTDPRSDATWKKAYAWLANAPEPQRFGPFTMNAGQVSLWMFPPQQSVDSGRYPRSDDAPVLDAGATWRLTRSHIFWIWTGLAFAAIVILLIGCGYLLIRAGEDLRSIQQNKPQASDSIAWQWTVSTALIFFLFLLTSYSVRGQWFGMLIDQRNRVSLSRTQWVAWTVLLIGAIWSLSLWNIGFGYNAQQEPFPKMMYDFWILLGIVNISAIANVLVLQTKATGLPITTASVNTRPPNIAPMAVTEIGQLDARTTPREASWIDLFIGEETSNRATVDVSRLQQFIITLLLLVFYAFNLGSVMSNLSGHVENLPTVGNTFLGLLAISHAGYLAVKSLPKVPPAPPS